MSQEMQEALTCQKKQGRGFSRLERPGRMPPCQPNLEFWPPDPYNHTLVCVQSATMFAVIYRSLLHSDGRNGVIQLADDRFDTWNCGIGEEKVGLHWDLVSGIGICVIDRT